MQTQRTCRVSEEAGDTEAHVDRVAKPDEQDCDKACDEAAHGDDDGFLTTVHKIPLFSENDSIPTFLF